MDQKRKRIIKETQRLSFGVRYEKIKKTKKRETKRL